MAFRSKEATSADPLDVPTLQLTAIIPEPGTLAIWALLAILGLGAGWRRRGRVS